MIGSSCIADRQGIEAIDYGAQRTPYMSFGDSGAMERRMTDDTSGIGLAIARRPFQP